MSFMDCLGIDMQSGQRMKSCKTDLFRGSYHVFMEPTVPRIKAFVDIS